VPESLFSITVTVAISLAPSREAATMKEPALSPRRFGPPFQAAVPVRSTYFPGLSAYSPVALHAADSPTMIVVG